MTSNEPARIHVGAIHVDDRVQRGLDRSRVKKMASDWKPHLGDHEAITLSRRADGRLYVVDGQHRVAAARQAFGSGYTLWAFVHTGLTIEDEARLFLELNQERKSVNSLTAYRVGLVGNEPDCLVVDRVLTKYGLAMASTPSVNRVAAPPACRKVASLPDGETLFERTISILARTWGSDERDRWLSDLIRGVGLVLYHNNETVPGVDDDRLCEVLGRYVPRHWIRVSQNIHGQGGSSSRQHALANLLVVGAPSTKGYNWKLGDKRKIVAPPLDERRGGNPNGS